MLKPIRRNDKRFRRKLITREDSLASDQIKQQLQVETEAIIMEMTATGRKTQEEIDHAKAFWKTPEGYKKRMEWSYLYNGEYLPDQLTKDCAD